MQEETLISFELISVSIEIQMQPKSDFAKRVSFYQAKMITEQVSKGSEYSDIQKVVSIIIADYKMFPDDGHYHSRFTMYDPANGREFSEVQEIHVLELPKLPEKDDGTELWAWAKFFTLISRKEFDMLAEMYPATEIKQAVAVLAELSEDERTRMLMEARQIYEVDKRMERDFVRREGRAEGMEEMLVSAIQNDAPLPVIEAMRQSAGVTESRLAELMALAKKTGSP